MAEEPGRALDLFRPSTTAAIVDAIDHAHDQMMKAADTGDSVTVAGGVASVDAVLDRMLWLRREAGRRANELLPDKHYTWRGEERTKKISALLADDTILVEPKDAGGGWRQIDYPKALRSVVDKQFGLETMLVASTGEIAGKVADVVALIQECFMFSGLRSNDNENTGLVAYGFTRSDFGEWTEPRHDVRVQRRGS